MTQLEELLPQDGKFQTIVHLKSFFCRQKARIHFTYLSTNSSWSVNTHQPFSAMTIT